MCVQVDGGREENISLKENFGDTSFPQESAEIFLLTQPWGEGFFFLKPRLFWPLWRACSQGWTFTQRGPFLSADGLFWRGLVLLLTYQQRPKKPAAAGWPLQLSRPERKHDTGTRTGGRWSPPTQGCLGWLTKVPRGPSSFSPLFLSRKAEFRRPG